MINAANQNILVCALGETPLDFAGTGATTGYADGFALTQADFNNNWGLAIKDGVYYIGQNGPNTLRVMSKFNN